MAPEIIDAVFENGVFKLVEPYELENGMRVGLRIGPPKGPLTREQAEAMQRFGHRVYEGMTEDEITSLEKAIHGERWERIHEQREQK